MKNTQYNKLNMLLKVFDNKNNITEDERRNMVIEILKLQKRTEYDLAFLLNVSQSTISYGIKGKKIIKKDFWVKMCIALKLPYPVSEKVLGLYRINLSVTDVTDMKYMNILYTVTLDIHKEDIELLIEEVNTIKKLAE